MRAVNEMTISLNFADHWRTRMLAEILKGDECAPLYVMRLWAYSVRRGAETFRMPAPILKALCRYTGDAEELEQALIGAYFIQRTGTKLTVVPWTE